MLDEDDIENQKDEENEKDNKAELEQFVPKETINRLTAINSRNTKDSTEMVPESEGNYEESTCSMKEGSILGGVFALSSLALGTGAFSIPIRCTQIGLFWYVIFIIIGATAAYWTLTGFIKAARNFKGKEFEDYSLAVKGIVGSQAGIFIDVIIVFYVFGVFVQYQVIIYSLIGRTIYEFFADQDKYPKFKDYEEDVWDSAKIKFPIMFGTTLLVTPLCLLKDISKMRFASTFAVCALIYCILVVVIQTPWFFKDYLDKYDKDDSDTHANWFDITKGFTSKLNFFTGIATVFFCYTCHPGAFPVFKTLKNHTEKRINTVFFRSICLDIVIYVLVAICGFMTAPTNPKSLIIYRETIFDNDIFMTIAKIALGLDLLLSLPANYNSYRCSFFLVFFHTDIIDNKRNLLVTIPTLLISTLIGALYKDILSYISFFGGFCSSIISYVIPGSMIILTSGESMTSKKNILRLIAVLCLATMGFMGGVETIRDNIRGDNEDSD